MAEFKPLSVSGDVRRTFASEDGKHYRHTRQEMDGVIKRVERLREQVNEAPKATNRNGWHYAGSVPMTVITDWLQKNGYTWPQFATNEDNAKVKFMAYFKSRDFAKLHTEHITTKRESSSVVVTRDVKR